VFHIFLLDSIKKAPTISGENIAGAINGASSIGTELFKSSPMLQRG
jgi:hypothetical protein